MSEQTETKADEGQTDLQEQTSGDSSGASGGGTQENENTTPSGKSEGKPGKITSDENRRFLSNIVANKGLDEAAETIAKKMKEVDGGIQVVTEFPTALDDFLLVDLRTRIQKLKTLLDDLGMRCQPYGDFEVPKIEWGHLLLNFSGEGLKRVEKEPAIEKEKAEKKIRKVDYAGIGGEISAGLQLISGTLGAVGDIIGYFRSDYSIKGQTIETPDQFTIEAVVTDQLVKLNREVYWVDFWQLLSSPLYQSYAAMVDKMIQVHLCMERLKINTLDPLEDHLTLLTAELNALKEKWLTFLNVPDVSQIQGLQKEITRITKNLHEARKNHIPDSFYTELQSHLSNLDTKVADEILKTAVNAKTNLDAEIQKIVQTLEKDASNPPAQQLSAVQKKALNDQLTIYQNALVGVVKIQGSNPLDTLKAEINAVQKQLLHKPDDYINDAELSVLETSLKTCTEKSTSWITGTDTVAKQSLETKIEAIKDLMKVDEREMGKVKALISEFGIIKSATEEFITMVSTVEGDSGISPLTRACLREFNFGERVKYLLKVKLVAADADVFIEDPSILVRFPNISYLGGAVISYVLLTKEGRVVSSGSASAISVIDQKVGKDPKKSNIRFDGKTL